MSRDKIMELFAGERERKTAVLHFNFASFFELKAVMQAAAELERPIFVASLPKVTKEYSPTVLRAAVDELKKRTGAEAYLHLDHTNSVELCKAAIDAGYDSVMIDASRFSLEENISAVKEVVAYAHPKNCAVEGEIGKIKSRGDTGDYSGEDCLVQVEDAAALAEEGGLDYLAAAIGTAHGFYQGKPKINFERLQEVHDRVKIPLVLHGGTGIPEEDVVRCIQSGIRKVNVGTIIRYTYLSKIKEEVEKQGALTPPVDLMDPYVTEPIKQVAMDWIKTCMQGGELL